MLAPHELKNKEFSKSIRGYNPQEVDEHIDFLLEKYTEAYRENSELERKLQSVISMLDQIKDDEESIRSTLVNAQKAGEKIIRDANDRADAIVNGIKERCDEVIARFKEEATEEVNNLWRIRTGILDFKKTVYALYERHLTELQGLSVNDITDIMMPDPDKIVNGIVSDVSNDFKRDLKELETKDDDGEDDDDADAATIESAETPTDSADDASVDKPDDSSSDDIDDFIKLIEEKSNE